MHDASTSPDCSDYPGKRVMVVGGGVEGWGAKSDLINMYITLRTCCIINQPRVHVHTLDTFLSLAHTSICRRFGTSARKRSAVGGVSRRLPPSARQAGRGERCGDQVIRRLVRASSPPRRMLFTRA